MEEPDLELPVQRRQSQQKTSTSTTSTAITTGKRLDNGCANASTASTRVRNADIFNRVNGRSSNRRPKPVPDFPAAAQQTHSGGIRNGILPPIHRYFVYKFTYFTSTPQTHNTAARL